MVLNRGLTIAANLSYLKRAFNVFHLISLQTLPEQWSVNEVCQWLEVMGLGAYKGAFRGLYVRTVLGLTRLNIACKTLGIRVQYAAWI